MAEPAVKTETQSDGGNVQTEKRERTISTIDFPYGSLDDAIAVAKAVHKLGGNECRLDSLAAEMGHDTTESGGFRQKISTAHRFGLTALSKGIVTLSALGARIIDPDQEKVARVEAFLKVPLYNSLYEEFKSSQLPPNQGLEAKMISLGVAAKQSDKARQAFQRSAKEAGFFAYGSSKLVYPALGNQTGAAKTKDAEKPPEPKLKNGGGDDDGGNGLPPYVQLLVSKLPEPETMWAMSGRKKWLEAALKIFDLVYEEDPADSEEELVITLGTSGKHSAN